MRRVAASALVTLVCASLLSAGALAGVAWRTTSTLSATVGPPLVELALGTGAARASFATGLVLSANHTAFSGTLTARAGGSVVVKDVVDVASKDTAARTVTLLGTQVTNSRVTTLTWTVRNGSTIVATLDLRAASPSATFTLPAGATYLVDLRANLSGGSGHDNADATLGLGLKVVVGAITMRHANAAPLLSASAPIVAMGPLAPGSTGGVNGSAGQANLSAFVSSVTSTTTHVLYLNNTGASTWYARLALASSTGSSGIVVLSIGINNGSYQPQVTGSLGSITSTGGAYVALAAGSTNRISITQAVTVGSTPTFTLDVYASDATDDTAYVTTGAVIRLT